ncbi:MAG: hypothetical protein PHW21_06270 [Candidatus Izemoplasmatales bacterium]|nr:hypothetical protein [Candidatus Izemoplasmatales bacterium]
MEKLNSYFDEIESRIDEVYEDLKRIKGSIKVSSTSQKEAVLLSAAVMGIPTDNYLYGYENLVLNISILMDVDNNSLNLSKILNKIQSNPKLYMLDEVKLNKDYKVAQQMFDAINNNPIYIDIVKQRDKLVAHCDLNFEDISSKLDLGKISILSRDITLLIEFIFSWFKRQLTPFNEDESNIEVIYKLYKKAGTPLFL